MAITLTCSCGQRLAAKDELAGKTVKCPKCQAAIIVPGVPARRPAPPPRQPLVEPPVSQPGGDLELDDLLLEEQIGVPQTGLAPAGPTKVCPSCHKLAPVQAVLCIECGWNFAEGKQLQTQRGPKRKIQQPDNPYAASGLVDDDTFGGRSRRQRDNEGQRNGPPWEFEEQPVAGFFQTLIEIVITPFRAFRNMRLYNGMGSPITYVLTSYVVAYVLQTLLAISVLWALGMSTGILPRLESGVAAAIGTILVLQLLCGIICTLVVGAVVLPITMMVFGGCLHLAALIVGGRRRYEASFRAHGYVLGATVVGYLFLNLIPLPYFSLLASTLIQAFYTTVAVKEVHEVSLVQAIGAAILDLIFSVAVIVAAVFLFAMALGMSLQTIFNQMQQRGVI